LNAAELAVHHPRQRARQQGLGDARNAFDQRVLVTKDDDQALPYGVGLADDHLLHLGRDSAYRGLKLLEGFVQMRFLSDK